MKIRNFAFRGCSPLRQADLLFPRRAEAATIAGNDPIFKPKRGAEAMDESEQFASDDHAERN
jgi:hypothetical protein